MLHAKSVFLIECWVDEKNASLTEQRLDAYNYFFISLLSKLCCVDENNHTFDEIEAGCEMSSCYDVYVYENNSSLIEAVFIGLRGFTSTCTLMKRTLLK